MAKQIGKRTLYKTQGGSSIILGAYLYDIMNILQRFEKQGDFTIRDVQDCFAESCKATVHMNLNDLVKIGIVEKTGLVGNAILFDQTPVAKDLDLVNKWLAFENMFDDHYRRPVAAAMLEYISVHGEAKYVKMEEDLEIKTSALYISMRKDSIPKLDIQLDSDGKFPYIVTLTEDGVAAAEQMKLVSEDLTKIAQYRPDTRHLFV